MKHTLSLLIILALTGSLYSKSTYNPLTLKEASEFHAALGKIDRHGFACSKDGFPDWKQGAKPTMENINSWSFLTPSYTGSDGASHLQEIVLRIELSPKWIPMKKQHILGQWRDYNIVKRFVTDKGYGEMSVENLIKEIASIPTAPKNSNLVYQYADQEIEHEVQPGDSLWRISRLYNCSTDSILKLNPNLNSSRLRVNQTVKIPQMNSVEFEGELEKHQEFTREFDPEFIFELKPSKYGWTINIIRKSDGADLSRYTPPLHGPNTRDVDGWHFRNSDNTGPNKAGPKNVNAPQKLRDGIIFSPDVGRTIPRKDRVEWEDIEKIKSFGHVKLEILDYDLEDLEPNQRAKFSSMKFRVNISWPRQKRVDEP